MTTRKPEGSGRGLQDEDLALIFSDPETERSSSRPTTAPASRDYEKAAAADDDEGQYPNEADAKLQRSNSEDMPPAFEEPWPDEQANSEGPKIQREQTVQALVQKASRPMTDSAKAPEPRIVRRVNDEPSPSDRTWAQTSKEIFGPAGLLGSSAPCPGGSVRPSIKGQDEEKQR